MINSFLSSTAAAYKWVAFLGFHPFRGRKTLTHEICLGGEGDRVPGLLLRRLLPRDVLHLGVLAVQQAGPLEPLRPRLLFVVEQYPRSGLEFLHEFLVLASALDRAARLHEASHLLEDSERP